MGGDHIVIIIVGVCLGALQTAIFAMLKQINTKMRDLCESNATAHREMTETIFHHYHNEGGDVVIRGK